MFIGNRIGIPMMGGDFSLYGQLNAIAPVTFFKDYRKSQSSGDADNAAGSKTITYSAARSGSAPATYFDADGNIQLLTTPNVPRWTQGYYDETGWHSAPGMIVEGAGTNLVLDSYFSQTFATYWRTIGAGSSISSSNEYPNLYLGGNVGKFVSTASGSGIGTSGTAKPASVSGNKYTAWALVKGSGTAKIYYQSGSGAAQYGTAVTLSDSWKMISFQVTADATDFANVGVVANDTNTTCYVSCIQLTQHSTGSNISRWPDTFIPTTTATATRPGESVSYAGTANFPAPTGNNTLSFAGQTSSGDRVVVSTGTAIQLYQSTSFSIEAWVFARSVGGNSVGIIVNKISGTTGFSLGFSSGKLRVFAYEGLQGKITDVNESLALNVWNHVVVTWSSGSAWRMFTNGTEHTYAGTPAALTTPDNDTGSLYFGNQSALNATWNGFIRRVRIFRDKALSQSDVTALYNSGTYTQNELASDRGVSGATAEYNFTDGSGTTLTDAIAANDGAITGATWVKDALAATVFMSMRPIALTPEYGTNYLGYFSIANTAQNQIVAALNGTAGSTTELLNTVSNNVQVPSGIYTPSRTRYGHYILTFMVSTELVETYRQRVYQNGTSKSTATTFPVPLLSAAGTMALICGSITTLNCAELENVVIFSRALTAAQVAQVNALLNA